jgi:hypothetical protein
MAQTPISPHQAGFTHGPWYYSAGTIYADRALTVPLAHIDHVTPYTLPTEHDANGRMMACAPSLYEAGVELLRVVEWWLDMGYLKGIDLELPGSVPVRVRELLEAVRKGGV